MISEEPDFHWDEKLYHRLGAPANLDGIDVFVKFDLPPYPKQATSDASASYFSDSAGG